MGKKVNMEVTDKPKVEGVEQEVQEQQISYEQLAELANQLHQQNQKLQHALQELAGEQFTVRVGMLFDIIKQPSSFPVGFVDKAREEIMELIYPTDEEEEEELEDKE